jgi:hypothetical protein
MRNVERSYLRYEKTRGYYRWFDLTNFRDVLKLSLLVISANLFLPVLLFSLYKMVKYKNWLYLLEAPITFLLVDTIMLAFLKDARGRQVVKRGFNQLLQRIGR